MFTLHDELCGFPTSVEVIVKVGCLVNVI
jgi:hypothetical protein